jgi:hypothetical protein
MHKISIKYWQLMLNTKLKYIKQLKNNTPPVGFDPGTSCVRVERLSDMANPQHG